MVHDLPLVVHHVHGLPDWRRHSGLSLVRLEGIMSLRIDSLDLLQQIVHSKLLEKNTYFALF